METKYHETITEKNISKYLLNTDLNFNQRENKSISPLSKVIIDAPKTYFEKLSYKYKNSLEYNDNQNLFIPIMIDDNDPFLFESKININENPFLSNLSQNFNNIDDNNFKTERNSNSFMKLRRKITLSNNMSNIIEYNFEKRLEINNNNQNLFNNSFLNSDILYNETLLNSISNVNFEKKNKDIDNIENIKIINSKNQKIEIVKKNDSLRINNLSEKENIVIEGLIALDKDYYNEDKDKNEMEFNNTDAELEENDFEKLYEINRKMISPEEFENKKNINEFIDKRLKQYYNYYKKNKTYKLNENQNEKNLLKNKINDILLMEETNEDYLFFSFKSIVIGLNNLIKIWLSNSHFKIYLKSINQNNLSFDNNNNINLDIFIELMDKYNTIKDICPFLEKDFKEIIDNFQQKKKIKFCLCELLTDLYWDYLFKIHCINYIFTNGYTLNNIKNNIIFEEAKHAMKAIIDILIVYDTSYKKNIGEILNLPYIKKENIFLMNYIIKFKKNANPFAFDNPCREQENEDNKNKNKENDDSINKKKKKNENKNTENFSLEEVYKYIQGDNDGKKAKKSKKRQKKKKNEKNVNIEIKNSNNKNIENKDYEQIDPIVEEFIRNLIEFNRNNKKIKKIKPNISQEWIKSIS